MYESSLFKILSMYMVTGEFCVFKICKFACVCVCVCVCMCVCVCWMCARTEYSLIWAILQKKSRWCSSLPRTAPPVCCNALQCVAGYCNVLQCVAVCCSVLQCVAVCCSLLQCVAACISLIDAAVCPAKHLLLRVAVCCSVLQCNTQQCVVQFGSTGICIYIIHTHV